VGDEREWIEEARRGNAAAQRALYEAHVDRIFRLAYRMGGDAALAEDWTQEAFVRAFDRLAQFRGDHGDASFGGWLRAVAVSVMLLRPRARTERDSGRPHASASPSPSDR
jgi:RNA polymerase sigma-70 factor (ECF subfamily)